MRAGRDVSLASDDRFDPGALRFLIKFDRSVQVAMIGNRNRRHLEFDRSSHEILHPDGTIEERVLGVKVEVNERVPGHLRSL
jgi:hypothetical protein